MCVYIKAAEGKLDYMFSLKVCVALSEYYSIRISHPNRWMFQEKIGSLFETHVTFFLQW